MNDERASLAQQRYDLTGPLVRLAALGTVVSLVPGPALAQGAATLLVRWRP